MKHQTSLLTLNLLRYMSVLVFSIPHTKVRSLNILHLAIVIGKIVPDMVFFKNNGYNTNKQTKKSSLLQEK